MRYTSNEMWIAPMIYIDQLAGYSSTGPRHPIVQVSPVYPEWDPQGRDRIGTNGDLNKEPFLQALRTHHVITKGGNFTNDHGWQNKFVEPSLAITTRVQRLNFLVPKTK